MLMETEMCDGRNDLSFPCHSNGTKKKKCIISWARSFFAASLRKTTATCHQLRLLHSFHRTSVRWGPFAIHLPHNTHSTHATADDDDDVDDTNQPKTTTKQRERNKIAIWRWMRQQTLHIHILQITRVRNVCSCVVLYSFQIDEIPCRRNNS